MKVFLIDAEYVTARNSLIPEAERHADGAVGSSTKKKGEKDREMWAAKWNRVFHDKMTALCQKQKFVPCAHCSGRGFIKEGK